MSIIKLILVFLFILAVSLFFHFPVRAKVIIPDSSFGGDGFVTYDDMEDYATDVAIQSDGKYVVCGYTTEPDWPPTDSLRVYRFNTDGTLDTTFSGDGIVTFYDGYMEEAHALDIQSDGKIVVTGSVIRNDDITYMIVLRYNTNGTLDTSFATTGFVYASEQWSYGYDVKVENDGEIVVVGESNLYQGTDGMTLWKYDSNGSLVSSFDSDGIAVFDCGADTFGIGYGIAIQTDGKYVVTGTTAFSGTDGLTTWRYNTDGSLDTSFSTDGYDKQFSGYDFMDGYDVEIQTDGKIIVTGYRQIWNNRQLVVLRYNTNGSLDTSFGTNGAAFFEEPYNFNAEGNDLVILDSGNIFIAGDTSPNDTAWDASLFSFNSDGTNDTNFYSTGYTSYSNIAGGDEDDGFSALQMISSDSFITVGLSAGSSDYDMLLFKGLFGYQIELPAGFNVMDAGGHNIEIGSADGIRGLQRVLVTDENGHLIVELEVDLSSDADWTHVTGQTNVDTKKSVITGFEDIAGGTGVHALFVPRGSIDDYVGICPLAQTLEEVTPECEGYFTLTEADPNVSIVNFGGISYWKVEAMYGTGGLSPNLPETGQNTLTVQILGIATLLVCTAIYCYLEKENRKAKNILS
ncbi:hypothetical protein JW766_00505 [Candidatus Dojkabacteria bacterium]|nr:hypothetical protein [Candidatus Dojkabacteria bacterium]